MHNQIIMREAASERLSPGLLNSRRYYLRKLGKALNEFINQYGIPLKKGRVLDFGCGNSPYQSLFDHDQTYMRADLSEEGSQILSLMQRVVCLLLASNLIWSYLHKC